jgi:TonB family protein
MRQHCTLMVRVALIVCVMLVAMPVKAQGPPSAKELEPLINSDGPIYLDGERTYRAKETEKKALITYKPEPPYTEKGRKHKVEGVVSIRAILSSAGRVRVLYTIKELPDGLTKEALKAAKKIKFEPATVGGKRVSVIVRLEYLFNL